MYVMMDRIKDYASFIVIGALTVVLILFPAPSCFNCESPSPYGIDASIVAHRADNIAVLFCSIVLLAGVLKLKYAWAIPPGFFVADGLTQHLAGVPWWSLRENEGPFIVFGDLIIGFLLLGFGFLCRKCFEWLKYRPKQTVNPSIEN
jgi:hypothetical protein